MADVTVSTTFDLPKPGTSPASVPSWAYVKTVLENLTISNIGSGDTASGVSFTKAATVQPTSPSSGDLWVDTGSTPSLLKIYSGTEWFAVWHVGTTAPTTTTAGLPWYDTTLDIPRAYDTLDLLAGWHPIDGAHRLMNNRGAAVVAGDVVVRFIGGANNRGYTSTTTQKHIGVVGVAVEAAALNADGVVAVCGGGAYVTVNMGSSTGYGTAAAGDGIATSVVAGESRTVGPLPGSAYLSTTTVGYGMPYGCFAEAMSFQVSPTSGPDTVRCRMLDSIGEGRRVVLDRRSISPGDSSADGVWSEQEISGVLDDASHAPTVSASIMTALGATNTGAPPGNISGVITLSTDQSTPHFAGTFKGRSDSAAAGAYDVAFGAIEIPTVDSTTTPTALGTVFATKVDITTGTTFVATFYVVGYTY